MNLAPPTMAFETVSQPACLAYLIPSRKDRYHMQQYQIRYGISC